MKKNERDNDPQTDRDHGNPAVVWQLSNDGLQPSKAPHGFIARNPLGITIPPGMSYQLNLQVQANVPLFAWPTKSRADYVTVKQFIQPGEDITVTVQNKSQHAALVIEDRESLVNLFPLVSNAVGVVVG